MADTKVSALDSLASVDRTTDLLYIVDASGPTSNKITVNNALGFSGGNPVSTSDTQTLTNKTITTPTLTVLDNALTIQDNSDNTKQLQLQLSGITTATTRTLTVPDANTTLVGTDTTQTLTNKTLTSPTINTATIANPTLTVNTVSEFTAANGVTVDGLLIKDGLLPAGNIQPLNLVSGTGSTWVWQSWSPTLVNLSGGTLNYAKYMQIGKTVHFRFKYTLAGAGVAGEVSITPPVAFHTDYTQTAAEPLGYGSLRDAGTNTFNGMPLWGTGGVILIRTWSSSNTATALSSTVPFTWVSGDQIFVAGTYEAA